MSERVRHDADEGGWTDAEIAKVIPRLQALMKIDPHAAARGNYLDALIDLRDARAEMIEMELSCRALVVAAITAENERLWAVFADLMDNEWPKRPDGSEYMQTDWNGLIDPRWPSDWPDRIMRDQGER